MSTFSVKYEPSAIDVTFTGHALHVVLADGREVSVPLAWFPRLLTASAEQLSNWRLIGGGVGIHWPDVDEDVSVERLMALA